LRSFKVNRNKNLINTEILKKFRFKIHHVSGPGFHTEFKLSIISFPSNSEIKKIEFSASNNVKQLSGEIAHKIIEDEFDRLVQIPFERGIERYIEFLESQKIAISTDLKIELIEYVYHPVDSKPIGNEIGMATALKIIFRNQMSPVEAGRCLIEELE